MLEPISETLHGVPVFQVPVPNEKRATRLGVPPFLFAGLDI